MDISSIFALLTVFSIIGVGVYFAFSESENDEDDFQRIEKLKTEQLQTEQLQEELREREEEIERKIQEREYSAEIQRKNSKDAQLICPHCQRRGFIKTWEMPVHNDNPFTGNDMLLVLLTGGLSLIFHFLQDQTTNGEFAHCDNCDRQWRIK